MKSKFHLIFLSLFYLLISGCSSSRPNISSDTLYKNFLSGDLRLDCKVSCAYSFGYENKKLLGLYQSGLWQDLARAVIEINFENSISYYYLGSSAQGLGELNTAKTYFKLAQASDNCITNTCEIINPKELSAIKVADIDGRLMKKEALKNQNYNGTNDVVLMKDNSVINQIQPEKNTQQVQSNSELEVSIKLKQLEVQKKNLANKAKELAEKESKLNYQVLDNSKKSDKDISANKPAYEDKEREKQSIDLKKEKEILDRLSLEKNTEIEKSNQLKRIVVKLTDSGGVYEVPVSLNDVLKINLILDSGAADVSISADVALTLIKTGTIQKSDWLPGQVYQFADGTTAKSERFMLKSITIGSKVIQSVSCSISKSFNAPMLLGQSALKRLGKYTIDYKDGSLQFE